MDYFKSVRAGSRWPKSPSIPEIQTAFRVLVQPSGSAGRKNLKKRQIARMPADRIASFGKAPKIDWQKPSSIQLKKAEPLSILHERLLRFATSIRNDRHHWKVHRAGNWHERRRSGDRLWLRCMQERQSQKQTHTLCRHCRIAQRESVN